MVGLSLLAFLDPICVLLVQIVNELLLVENNYIRLVTFCERGRLSECLLPRCPRWLAPKNHCWIEMKPILLQELVGFGIAVQSKRQALFHALTSSHPSKIVCAECEDDLTLRVRTELS